MIETIALDTRKGYSTGGKLRISPLRRGERDNVTLSVAVRCDRRPYDLTGMTAHLVWQAADGKLVGPVPMEVDACTVRCTLPDACYSAVGTARAYIEIRDGAELVDTTDEMLVKVLDCIDTDGEQAEEYKPLIGEVRDATDAAKSAADRAESGEDERIATEGERVSAESARKQAESERVKGWADLKADAEKTVGDAVKRADSAADRATHAASSASAAGDAATAAAAKAEKDTKAAVDSASASVSKAVADAKTDVDAAVGRSDAATTKAETAVETANAANKAANKAVTDAQAAIAEVKATEANLYPAAENILVGSETGAVVHVEDAFAGASLRKITVEGASKQDGTPSPDNPVQIQSIENPVVKVTGKNSEPKATRIDLKGNGLCSLTENLQWMPKTYKDELAIDYEGNVSLTKRVFSAHIDERETLWLGNTDNYQYFNYTPKTVRPIDGSRAIRSNRFYKIGREPWNFYIAGGINAAFFFTFPLGTFANVDELKEWLVKNPIDVDYLGAETQTIQLGKIEMPTLTESTSDVWTDAEVTPNTSIEYVRDVNIVVANLESAIASITEG